jgi:PadR family transcriptional regulator PadR
LISKVNREEVQSMKKPVSYIGEFEELVLLAILSLGENAYGVPIRQALEEATGRSVTIGSLYTTLGRLEGKGLVQSRIGEATAERGGRAKRYYQVKSSAKSTLREVQAARERLKMFEPAKGGV